MQTFCGPNLHVIKTRRARLRSEGLRLTGPGGDFEFLRDGYLARARLNQANGNLDSALAFIQKAAQTIRRSQPAWDTAVVEAWQARLWLAQGNLPAAEWWAQACGLSVDDELCFLNEFGHMTLARVRLAQGRLGEARRLIERLLAAAESAGRMGRVIEMLVLQADNDALGALAALKRALLLAEPEGYVRTFVDEGAPLAELLLWGVERNTWTGPGLAVYVNKLLSHFGLQPPAQSKIQNLKSELAEALDQAALYGLLARLRDLGLILLAVAQEEKGGGEDGK